MPATAATTKSRETQQRKDKKKLMKEKENVLRSIERSKYRVCLRVPAERKGLKHEIADSATDKVLSTSNSV